MTDTNGGDWRALPHPFHVCSIIVGGMLIEHPTRYLWFIFDRERRTDGALAVARTFLDACQDADVICRQRGHVDGPC